MTSLRTIAAVLLAALLGACGSAPEVLRDIAPAQTRSVEQADQRLAAVQKERAAIEARFAERERVCYGKFFVNHCIDEAKERRRSALAAQRVIEIEAERFKRQEKVNERDRALAQAEAGYRAEEARMAAQPPAPAHQVTEAPPPRPAPVAERLAKHNAREQQAAERDQASAAGRAAKVAEFEKRKAESAERQRRVAERKAEKAAQAAKEQQPAPAPTPAQ